MPNTVAHIGLQGALTRLALPAVDLKWVLLGLALPDLPWILQRLAQTLVAGDGLYDLRLYAVAQSSLFVCAVLCLALALLSTAPGVTFAVLFANGALHLLLDALQTKFANGVHFLAPLSWKLSSWNLFWPESPLTAVLTLLGPLFLLHAYANRNGGAPVGLSLASRRRLLAAAMLAIGYMTLPLLLMHGPYIEDNHSVRALMEPGDRSGRAVEFDRNRLTVGDGGPALVTFAGEPLRLLDLPEMPPGIVSIRGRFVDHRTVAVQEVHRHAGGLRDWASYVGLLVVLLVWGDWARGRFRAQRNGREARG